MVSVLRLGIFVILFHMANFAQSEFYWQNPKPTGNNLLSVTFVDELNGWAVGRNGTIIHSNNGGNVWFPQISGTQRYLKSVSFTDVNNGWAVGDSGTILRTTNGGLTWLNRSLDVGYAINSVKFLTPLKGFICAGEGRVFVTNTGGNSWSQLSLVTTSYLASIFFLDQNNGWIAGYTTILRTTDGGANWVPVISGSPEFVDIRFFDNQIGVATKLSGEIHKTTNGGTSWTQLVANLNNKPVRSTSFVSQNILVATTSDGSIFRSSNGGVNWTFVQRIGNSSLNNIFIKDAFNAWIVGDNGVTIRSSNDGSTWLKTTISMTDNSIKDIVFIESNRGCAVTSDGKILKTTSGGATWEIADSNLTQSINKMFFHSSRLGWAVGDVGAIFKTTDGGFTWQTVYSGTVSNLLSVCFVDSLTGWVSGSQGKVMKTTDSGESWITQAIGYSDSLNAIFFLDPQIGYIAAKSGGYKTVNGGITWAQMPGLSTRVYYDLFFTNASVGWAVGPNSRIYKTTDGGQNWVMQFTNTTFTTNFRRIKMTSENNGMVVGGGGFTGGGYTLKTTDGGSSWNLLGRLTDNELYSLFIDNQNNIWMAGANGTLLSTVVPTIPVNLTNFNAFYNDGMVRLDWQTATETNNRSFIIERKNFSFTNPSANWEVIGERSGSGTTTETKFYQFIDDNPGTGKNAYRLKQVDYDGSFKYSDVVEVEFENSMNFELFQNYPNPFNPSTTIEYNLPKDGKSRLTIYDLLGNRVKTESLEYQKAGLHKITIDFTDFSSGIYIYEIKSSEFVARKKMIFLK